MKILVVSTCTSHPIASGQVYWINAQCTLLQKMGHEVHYLYVKNSAFYPIKEEYMALTKKYWKNHYYEYSPTIWDKRIIAWRYWIRAKFGIPSNFLTCDSQYYYGLSLYVRRLQKEQHFDACIVQYFFLTKLFNHVKFPRTAVSTHDRYGDRHILTHDPYTMYISRSSEAKAMNRCQYIFALQENEKEYFQKLAPKRTVLNVFGYYEYKQCKRVGNKNAVILSSDNPYNVAGIKWFIDNVLPKVSNVYPDFKLVMGGAICNVLKDFSGNSNIQMLGVVPDASDLYSKGDVAINPVSEGTGLKIKTFESIQYDKVTIVHPHSTIGIYAPEQSPLIVAETVEQWVDAFKKVWGSPDVVDAIKVANKQYLGRMTDYIKSQYNLFLS